MKCVMCGLGKKYLKTDAENTDKLHCQGCGTKFFNRESKFSD